MESDYLTAKIDPGGSEVVRQPNSTPVASQMLTDYDAKMTWVRSTLSEILQSRLKFLDAPIIDCDQRILSLPPRRQSRATWCTNDLHALLICIYEHYGPTRTRIEGPSSNGLSWINFYRLFDIEQGRTKQVVHVIWIQPGEALVKRIHEKTSKAEKAQEEMRLPGSTTFSECTLAVESCPTSTKGLHPEVTPAPVLNIDVARRSAISAAEAPAANTTLTTATTAPQTQSITTTKIHTAGSKSASESRCQMPHVSTDGGLVSEVSPEKRDGLWNTMDTQKPKKAKDEEWGIISCVSMDSTDGSWTLILDEDLAW